MTGHDRFFWFQAAWGVLRFSLKKKKKSAHLSEEHHILNIKMIYLTSVLICVCVIQALYLVSAFQIFIKEQQWCRWQTRKWYLTLFFFFIFSWIIWGVCFSSASRSASHDLQPRKTRTKTNNTTHLIEVLYSQMQLCWVIIECLWTIINTATRWLHKYTHTLLGNSSDPLWKFGIWRPITLIILPFSSITLIHMLSVFYFSCVCIVGCLGLSVSQHKIAPNSEKRVYVYSGQKRKRGLFHFHAESEQSNRSVRSDSISTICLKELCKVFFLNSFHFYHANAENLL